MSTLSIRLSKELDSRLCEESLIAREPKSLLARMALEEFLKRRRHDRFVAELARAAAAINAEEAKALAAEALPLDNEALEMAEGRRTSDELPEGPDRTWPG